MTGEMLLGFVIGVPTELVKKQIKAKINKGNTERD